MMHITQSPYSVYLPIAKAYDSEDGKRWIFEAPLSEPGKDLQKERMNVPGLRKGLETFKRLDMPVDWDHLWERSREPRWLIGKGLNLYDAPHPKTGEVVPWVRGVLFKSKEIARQAKEHWDACKEEGDGGGLGISVAGQVVSRDPLDKSHILESMVTSIALTPVPVVDQNSGTVNFLKAFCAAEEALQKGGSLTDYSFPYVPELYPRLVPAWHTYVATPGLDIPTQMRTMRKAMEATGAIPHSGPGANALELEHLAGAEREEDAEEATLRRLDLEPLDLQMGDGNFKKAFDQLMAARLRVLIGR